MPQVYKHSNQLLLLFFRFIEIRGRIFWLKSKTLFLLIRQEAVETNSPIMY